MPAKSKAQQRYMAIAEHNPTALYGPKPNMTQQAMHDFAATPRTGLPTHVKASQPAQRIQAPRVGVPPSSPLAANAGQTGRTITVQASHAAALASHPHAARLGKFLHAKKVR